MVSNDELTVGKLYVSNFCYLKAVKKDKQVKDVFLYVIVFYLFFLTLILIYRICWLIVCNYWASKMMNIVEILLVFARKI